MKLTPKSAAVSTPPGETVTNDVSSDCHCVSALTSLHVPAENVAIAVSCFVSPTAESWVWPLVLKLVTNGPVGPVTCVTPLPLPFSIGSSQPALASSTTPTTRPTIEWCRICLLQALPGTLFEQ